MDEHLLDVLKTLRRSYSLKMIEAALEEVERRIKTDQNVEALMKVRPGVKRFLSLVFVLVGVNTASAQTLPNDIPDLTANCPNNVVLGQTLNITNDMTVPCMGIHGTVNLTSHLSVGTLYVYPEGKLTCRPAIPPRVTSISFQSVAPSDPEQYGTSLITFGANDCQGTPKTRWARLSVELLKGQNTITFPFAPSGWLFGDEIFIARTEQQPEGTWSWQTLPNWPLPERFKLVSLNGTTWTLDHPAMFDHPASRDADFKLELFPAVGNITRDVKIYSEGPIQGHVMYTGDAQVNVKDVEFRKLGRTTLAAVQPGVNQKGRYAPHFHMMGASARVIFDGNAIVDATKWCLTVHSSNGGSYTNNVATGCLGSGLMTEVGNEQDNLFEGNYFAGIIGTGARADSSCSGDGTLGCDGSVAWFSGPMNRVRNNLFANGINCINLWGGSPVNGVYPTIKEFSGNEAVGCMDGLQAWYVFGGGDISNQKVSNFIENGFFGYPTTNLRLVDWVVRGDPRMTTKPSRGIWEGDYATQNMIVLRPNIQNTDTGVLAPYGTAAGRSPWVDQTPQVFVVDDGYFNGNNADLRWQQAGLSPEQYWPGFSATFKNNMHGPKSTTHIARLGPLNAGQTKPVTVTVENYQKVTGDNFSVYSNETAPAGAVTRAKILDKVIGGNPPADPDSDNDGVKDSLDKCPGTPAGTPVDATGCSLPPPQGATIFLNPSQRLQTFQGWEGAVLASIQDYQSIPAAQLDAALTLAVNEMGVTRARLAIRNGVEGAGASSFSPINDNSDPNNLDITKFDFSNLDWAIEHFIIPLRQKLVAKGETFYTGLQYVDHSPNTSFEHWADPREYAEFMLAVFTHMRDKYGFVPNGIDVVNEPNGFADWTGQKIGSVIVATAAKLQASGFAVPEFITPSTSNMQDAPSWIDGVMSISGTAGLVKELSYHRYGGDLSNLQAIAAKGQQYGLRTSQLEWWGGAGYQALHQDLAIGNVAAWQQGAFIDAYGCGNSQWVTLVNGTPAICTGSALTRQYTKYVRPGAQRIGATGNATFEPLAFINSSGNYVVVVKAESGSGPFSISGLPAGTYGVYWTDIAVSQPTHDLSDVNVTAGQSLSLNLPSSGILTVYKKSGGPPPDPDSDNDGVKDSLDKCPGTAAGTKVDANGCPIVPSDTTPPMVSLTTPTNGATVQGTIPVTASASDNVGVVGVQFVADGANLGTEFLSPPWTTQWSTLGVADGAHALTAIARDAAGNRTISAAVTITVKNQQLPLPDQPIVSISQCLVKWPSLPPDTTHTWTVRIRRGGNNIGTSDSIPDPVTGKYEPFATIIAGPSTLVLRWTSGTIVVTSPPQTVNCGG